MPLPNRLTKIQSRAVSEEENLQTNSFRPKAPKGSSNVKEHQEGEGLLTNDDSKDNLDPLASENHLPRHSNYLMERQLRAKGTYLGTIVHCGCHDICGSKMW